MTSWKPLVGMIFAMSDQQVYKRVWTANEGPLYEFIYYHHEMVLVCIVITFLVTKTQLNKNLLLFLLL